MICIASINWKKDGNSANFRVQNGCLGSSEFSLYLFIPNKNKLFEIEYGADVAQMS